MTVSRQTTTYEVQTLRGTRWEIHARFDGNGRQMALTRARAMDRHPRVLAVRVVKEIYDAELGGAEEFIIYKSRRAGVPLTARPQVTPRRRRLPRRLGQFLSTPLPLGALAAGMIKAVATSPQWTVLPRALLGTTAAFCGAVLVTGMTAYMLGNGRPSAPSATSGTDAVTLLAVFSGIFLFGAVLVGFLLTAGPPRGGLTILRRKRRRPRPPSIRSTAAPSPSPALRPAPPTASAKDEPSAPLSGKAEELRRQVVDYLRQVIQPARGAYDLKDSYIRFGINLFVAGACETLCQERGIEAPTAPVIMAAGLRAVGVEADHAASLAENYVEYLISDSRYMAMFGRGREAIVAHLTAKADAADRLLRALDEWTQAHPAQDARNIVTVMFTRMIGFDEFVIAQGDEAARQAVHTHNQIVDRRLAEFRGKRIKHIHDGTMAAFMATADAVRAANAIRMDFAEQSRQSPDRRLTLAIGLNCGEPIAEGNDLFGASVQLAARVVGTAKPDQILVSQAVRDRLLTEVPTMTFATCGPFSLKGFSDPLPLYELTGI